MMLCLTFLFKFLFISGNVAKNFHLNGNIYGYFYVVFPALSKQWFALETQSSVRKFN